MHPVVKFAKETVEEYTRTGHVPEKPSEDNEVFSENAGVFVCLKKHGQLRGCIGTILPQTASVVEEVKKNAVSAATCDPRFPPVTPDELPELDYSVDVLTAPEPVSDIGELDPRKYGVIVTKDLRRGLLLPDLEGVDTVDSQIGIAMAKAGIGPDEEGVRVERFEVKRYK